ncbi:MAG: pyridoxamine 5'-phosphate oxidase family protein [Bacteroidetes bacterium]|nr:pyridoxamine 5'-phosphate oxidase family protein [Bacteroidota bacterium]
MNTVPEKIIKFIKKHHLLNLSTVDQDGTWSCSCFYAYLPEENMLIITSDNSTKHIKNLSFSNKVSGTIALETKIIGLIRGIQFAGEIKKLEGNELKIAEKAYLKRFPIARLMETTLWSISPKIIKMTDNRLGFGKKLIWEL